MHQPYYKSPISGIYEMPWVFLHAVKDYYEMPWHASRFKNITVSFNLVPSLLKQLEEYSSDDVKCKFLNIIRKETSQLTPEEKKHCLEFLFYSNTQTMIKPSKRYYGLYLKKVKMKSYSCFSNSEILDLEVLFLLAWSGIALRKESNIIKELIKKQMSYSENDKAALLNEMKLFLKQIIPFYQKLHKDHKIGLTTTPFYHPIVPLLIDINSAKETMPHVKLPDIRASFKNDAEKHISYAVDFFKNTFGENPESFWPSEGSISSGTLQLFQKYGVKQTFSDEDVLFNSLEDSDRKNLYKIYSYQNINIAFRDKTLSDLIGFSYKNWKPKAASEDFLKRLRDIYSASESSPLVSVILDGENAWESFPDNADGFFEEFYAAVEKQDWIETIAADSLDDIDVEHKNLDNIRAGSWIGGTFSTWIGDNEKNRAWEILSKTKLMTEDEKNLDRSVEKQVEDLLMTAEGSDWFWWYGDGHFSKETDSFDYLFRANLIKIYETLNKNVPEELLKPIEKVKKRLYIQTPSYYISPKINGRITSYFEWINAGMVDLETSSAMDTSGFNFKKLYYGRDRENLYLRIDGNFPLIMDKNFYLRINIGPEADREIVVYISQNKNIKTVNFNCVGIDAKIKDICEIKIPVECLTDSKGKNPKSIEIFLILSEDGKIIRMAPEYDIIHIDLDGDFDYNWSV